MICARCFGSRKGAKPQRLKLAAVFAAPVVLPYFCPKCGARSVFWLNNIVKILRKTPGMERFF